MFKRAQFRHMGSEYVIVDALAFGFERAPVDEELEHVSHFEARHVLEGVARRDRGLFERLCAAFNPLPGPSHVGAGSYRFPQPLNGADPRLSRLIEGLGRECTAESSGNGPPALARLYVLRRAKSARAGQGARISSQEQPLDRAIAQLGRRELPHRGHRYRVTRVGAEVPDRSAYETLGEREALALLKEMADDSSRAEPERAALGQLLLLLEDPHHAQRRAELLLLRRWRIWLTPSSTEPALTPSQLREAQLSHYVAVETVDKQEQPVSGVRLEVLLADGSRKVISTKEGYARLDNVMAGTVTIRVLDLDGRMWKPLNGAAAQRSNQDAAARRHIIKRGETLSKIAREYGLQSWKALWDDPENEPLRQARSKPTMIRPGDEVRVPGVQAYELRRETDVTHRIMVERGPVRRAYVIEAHDLRFHPRSCVFLGECSDLTDPQALAGASGVDALATALLYARDNPARKLLIVGHSDASGDPEQNQTLSERRALSLKHLLLGEREPWVELVHEQSTIADYQQILAWFSIVYGWPCAPFEVSGARDPDNERILRAFQTAYNKRFEASISEDGAIGPQTWGAIFDVYREQLAARLATDAAGLGELCTGVQFCGVKQAHGCASALALRSGAADDAPAYRRADLMFFEAGEEPSASDLDEGPPAPPDFSLHDVPVEKGPALVWLSLQTVDELGHRLPGVELVFRSGDAEVRHTTDGRGLWHGQVRAQCDIQVSAASGSMLGLGAASEFGESVELSPSWAATAITDVVVQGAVEAELLEAHAAHVARYDPAPEGALKTLRTGNAGVEAPPREPMEQPGVTGERTLPTRRAIRARAADNLFMAAELDVGNLSDVLNVWLEDYYPEVLHRGYLLEVIVGQQLAIFDSEGNAHHLFDLAPDVDVRGGRTGVHALLETGRERQGRGAMFVDLAQGRTAIDIGRRGIHGYEPEPASDSPDARTIEVVRVVEVVAPRDQNAYLDVLWGAQARGQHRLVYLWLSDSTFIAANGGTGMLEPYPKDETVRKHVHARNKSVVATMKSAYGAYIDDFIAKVRAIEADAAVAQAQGKEHPELQLYELLPPWPSAEVPTPVGITDAELRELVPQGTGSSEFMAWQAITEKHNEIWGVRTAGSLWLAIEFSTEAGFGEGPGGGGKLALKLNFEVSTDHKTDAIEITPSAEKTIFLKNFELDPESGVVKGSLKSENILGPFEADADSTGKLTLKYGGASASYDRASKQLGLGLGGSISLRDLVTRGMELRGKTWSDAGEPVWLKKLPELSAEVSLNAQLSRPSDVLAVVSNAPGLVAMGSRKQFMEADWGSLRAEQREALKALGWDEERWDRKKLPKSAEMPYDRLTSKEMEAAAKLPVPKEEAWLEFWRDLRE